MWTDPSLPWVLGAPRRSRLIQLSACGALNRHRTGRARRKWSACSRESLFHLRKESAQNLVPTHLGTTHDGSGVGQRESGPGLSPGSSPDTTLPNSPLPELFSLQEINILLPFSTWQVPRHPPIPSSNSTSSVRPSLLIPWD